MGINLCGGRFGVPHHSADAVEVNSRHGHVAGEGMPERMQRAFVDIESGEESGESDRQDMGRLGPGHHLAICGPKLSPVR